MPEPVWINTAAFVASHGSKTLEQIGREAREAIVAFQEGRFADLPEWMALSVDNGQLPGDDDES